MIRIILILFIPLSTALSQELKIAKVKYQGGGDWYANKTALPNLITFCNQQLGTAIDHDEIIVEIGSTDIYLYPYLYLTGHGNVNVTTEEAENLRNYLIAGGFLHIDDNYGLDTYIRPQMKKVFPNREFIEVPFNHPIYHQKFDFPTGLPKIHEHDGLPPKGYGIFYEGRLVCFYSYESDLGNGWEDQSIYNDPEEVRQKALKMGANIISYVFTGYSNP